MISSMSLAEQISLDLDQNAYTSWHDQKKLLDAINSACHFLHIYTQRPRTVELERVESEEVTDVFTISHEAFFPYRAEVDGMKLERTNIPLVGRPGEKGATFYVDDRVVSTTKKGKVLQILYHRGHNKLTKLGENDLNIPHGLKQALVHLSLWFIYPGGMDLGSSLANQNFQMAEVLLKKYSVAYGFNLQPSQIAPSPIY